jgi:hypothetical protein
MKTYKSPNCDSSAIEKFKKTEITECNYLGSSPIFKGKGFIYTVTSIDDKSYDYEFLKKNKKYKTIGARCWGWCPTLKEAQKAVSRNAGDMSECSYYTHVVITKTRSGIPSVPYEKKVNGTWLPFEWWYRWEVREEILDRAPVIDPKDRFQGKWTKCEKPKWSDHICGWGLG